MAFFSFFWQEDGAKRLNRIIKLQPDGAADSSLWEGRERGGASVCLQPNTGIWRARTAHFNAAGLLLSDRPKGMLHLGKPGPSSATLNAPSYHRSVCFWWQTDSYFTTSLCLNGPLHLVYAPPATHTHAYAHTQQRPDAAQRHFTHSRRVLSCCVSFMLWGGRKVNTCNERLLVDVKEEGTGERDIERRRERHVRMKQEGWKQDESPTWKETLNKQNHRWSPETATFDSKCHFSKVIRCFMKRERSQSSV